MCFFFFFFFGGGEETNTESMSYTNIRNYSDSTLAEAGIFYFSRTNSTDGVVDTLYYRN